MNDSLLDAVIETTVAANTEAATLLERFLAARTGDALALWLGQDPGRPAPTRESIQRRLVYDIAVIDELLNEQVNAILHHPRFQALEASWRGLRYLTEQIGEDDNILVRVLDLSWKDLTRDLERAIEFDQSHLFRKIYSAEFGMPGGQPYGVLLGDYRVHHRPSADHPLDDVGTLRAVSQVAAAAFAPFVASAHPSFLGLDKFNDLERPLDLAKTFAGVEYTKWNAFRDSEDARFVGLVLPRILLRLPYPDYAARVDRFRFAEDRSDSERSGYLWGNAVYAFGAVLVRAFAETGWLAAIRGVERGVEGGGLVTGLPLDSFDTDAPGRVRKCPTDVMISDVQEKDLGDLGFIPLTNSPGTGQVVFYGNQSVQKPRRYDALAATVNAKLSSMLQYMLCVSRFAHYLKVIGRDRVGSFTNANDCEHYLNNWLVDYSTSNEDVSSDMQAKYPLSQTSVSVREVPGKPGVYRCVVHLRPHFQLDQLTSSVKLVTEIVAGSQA